MSGKHYYTDEKNAQIVIALLKAHGIRKVIANPGTTNIAFVGSVQNDPWFEVYSGVDERHSAYMAVGMAAESGEPVVLSCTGATASRNYFPALTEAYYRKLPILALTSIHHLGSLGNLLPQMLDRTVQPKDTVRHSVQIPTPHTEEDIKDCVLKINRAILELTRDGGGPVHINLETSRITTFNTVELPKFRTINRVTYFSKEWPVLDSNQKIVIWIGAHKKFSDEEIKAIETFVERYNAIVCVDATSNYRGKGAVNCQLLVSQKGFSENPKYASLKPDLQIQLGEISGDYTVFGFVGNAKNVWRVSEDGEVRDLFYKLSHIFAMPEIAFFNHYNEIAKDQKPLTSNFDAWLSADAELHKKMPELPFSNLWMASKLHNRIQPNSVVHFGILNSLRTWNYFPLNSQVESSCNVGGFGIDGILSTLIGASLVKKGKLFYGVLGDLAFFYDLNSLGNKHIGKNLRILLVNNGCGAEFKLSTHYGSQFGDQTEDYIAAGHHFGNKSPNLVRHYATDLGFKYITASSKEEFNRCMDEFLSTESDCSIVFECFTSPKDESDALEMIRTIDPLVSSKTILKSVAKSVLPKGVIEVAKRVLK